MGHVKDSHIWCSIFRNSPRQVSWKTTDDIVRKSEKSPAYRRRGLPRDLNLEPAENNFHQYFPARSAPSSGYSSPVLSPQRYGTVDLIRPAFQVPLDLDISSSDRVSKFHRLSSLPTPENSPLHSPTSQSPTKHEKLRNCNGVFMHSHNKPPPECSGARNDTNGGNVHPLPRPPTVSRTSPTTTRHSFEKSDISSIKGLWQKGRPIGRGTYGSVYIATHRYVEFTRMILLWGYF